MEVEVQPPPAVRLKRPVRRNNVNVSAEKAVEQPPIKEEVAAPKPTRIENPLKKAKTGGGVQKAVEIPHFLREDYDDEVQIFVKKTEMEKEFTEKYAANAEEKDSDSEEEEKRGRKLKRALRKEKRLVKDLKSFVQPPVHYRPPEDTVERTTNGGGGGSRKVGREETTEDPWVNAQEQSEFNSMIRDDFLKANANKLPKLNKSAGEGKDGTTPQERQMLEIKTLVDRQEPLSIQKFYMRVEQERKSMDNKGKRKREFENPLSDFYVSLRYQNEVYKNLSTQYKFMTNMPVKTGIPADKRSKEEEVNILPLSRSYEESYMRTPFMGSNERECVNGDNCEWYNMHGPLKQPGVEFLEPDEAAAMVLPNAKPPDKHKPCIICIRKEVTVHWANIRKMCGSISGNWIFQNYYNITDEDGEYVIEQCIKSSSREYQGIILPVALHAVHWYTQVEENGTYYYRQTGYTYPEKKRATERNFC